MSTSSGLSVPARGTLADLLPETFLVDAALVVGAACFVGLLAQLQIHLSWTPVPITGQTLGVLLAGSALGWKRGSIAMAFYLAAGMIGMPWYAGHASGWSVATGATGGYLFGFIIAAAVCGLIAEQGNDRRILSTMGSMIVGNAIIYACGVTWLAHTLGVGLSKAVSLGLTPFLLGDVIKVVLAALILPGTWRLVGKLRTKQ